MMLAQTKTTAIQASRMYGLAASLILCTAAVAWPAERAIRLKVSNRTGDRILGVYVTPSRSPKWGPNLLKQEAVQADASVALSFEGACGLFDVRIVSPGGREYFDDEVELCEVEELRVDATSIAKQPRSEGQ